MGGCLLPLFASSVPCHFSLLVSVVWVGAYVCVWQEGLNEPLCCIFLDKLCYIKKAWFDLIWTKPVHFCVTQALTFHHPPPLHCRAPGSPWWSSPWLSWRCGTDGPEVKAKVKKIRKRVQKWQRDCFSIYFGSIQGFFLSNGPDQTAVSRLWPLGVTTDSLLPVEAERDRSICQLY